ncbi:hypothetical protein MACH01_04420 [Thalassospira tepidiphila]|nr:hypothetical protein MACH01_04420 [Thalassospira tepidiphila]
MIQNGAGALGEGHAENVDHDVVALALAQRQKQKCGNPASHFDNFKVTTNAANADISHRHGQRYRDGDSKHDSTRNSRGCNAGTINKLTKKMNGRSAIAAPIVITGGS